MKNGQSQKIMSTMLKWELYLLWKHRRFRITTQKKRKQRKKKNKTKKKHKTKKKNTEKK